MSFKLRERTSLCACTAERAGTPITGGRQLPCRSDAPGRIAPWVIAATVGLPLVVPIVGRTLINALAAMLGNGPGGQRCEALAWA